MLHIHGRALQQFLEIIILMKNGFADGAYASWRSVFELIITNFNRGVFNDSVGHLR